MRVLVIGSGAREHALLLALRSDPQVTGLIIAPGNAGTARVAEQHDVDITSGEDVVTLARDVRADLVVIGPEVPLVLGVADAVRAAGIACFGPSKDAAQIEGSKAFAKEVMLAAGVRTAKCEIIDNPANLDAALGRFGPPADDPAWVVKDDQLAAGKGVVVTADRDVARAHAAGLLEAGHPVLLVILPGRPGGVAVLRRRRRNRGAVVAGSGLQAGDTGPNTGGMGAYAPLPWLPDDVCQAMVTQVAEPVAAEMVRRGVRSVDCYTRVSRSPRTGRPWSNSTAASVIRRPRPYWLCWSRRSGSCCMRRPPARWPTSASCVGATAPR